MAIAIQAVLVLQLALRTASHALEVAATSPAGAASSRFLRLTLHLRRMGHFSASLGEPSISMRPASDPNEADSRVKVHLNLRSDATSGLAWLM